MVASSALVSKGRRTFKRHTFKMKLRYTNFPTTAYIQVFARNSNGVRAYAKLASGLDRVDTVTVVAGVTPPPPLRGAGGGALFYPGHGTPLLPHHTQKKKKKPQFRRPSVTSPTNP